MTKPVLTVLITTRGRPSLLRQALRSLVCQSLAGLYFEVIVVIDGEDEADSIEACAPFFDQLTLAVEVTAHSGIAAARNVGLELARGTFIRFQDDDDYLEPDCLLEVLKLHSRRPREVAVLGRTEVAEVAQSPVMHFATDSTGFLFSYTGLTVDQALGFEYFWGGRSSISTEIARVLRFNELFVFGAEDIEFGFRAETEFGVQVRYCPSAVQKTLRRLSVRDLVYRRVQQGYSAAYINALHPRSAAATWALAPLQHGCDPNWIEFTRECLEDNLERQIRLLDFEERKLMRSTSTLDAQVTRRLSDLLGLAYLVGFLRNDIRGTQSPPY